MSPAPKRSRQPARVVQLKKALLPGRFENQTAYKAALKYRQMRRSYRLGRSNITDPRVFNHAETVALLAERNAMRVFRSPEFRAQLAKLPLDKRNEVIERYRSVRKVAGTLRNIGQLDRLQHQQSPELLSRRTFTADIRRALANPRGQPITVGMIDLDDFKPINTKWSHVAGDAALNYVAKRLSQWARQHGGYAARIGGEEYQFFLPIGPEADRVVAELREQIVRETRDPHFFVQMGLPTEPLGWKRTLNFSASLTSIGQYTRRTDAKKMYASLAKGIGIAKKKEGKGSTVYTPWGLWMRRRKKVEEDTSIAPIFRVKTKLY